MLSKKQIKNKKKISEELLKLIKNFIGSLAKLKSNEAQDHVEVFFQRVTSRYQDIFNINNLYDFPIRDGRDKKATPKITLLHVLMILEDIDEAVCYSIIKALYEKFPTMRLINVENSESPLKYAVTKYTQACPAILNALSEKMIPDLLKSKNKEFIEMLPIALHLLLFSSLSDNDTMMGLLKLLLHFDRKDVTLINEVFNKLYLSRDKLTRCSFVAIALLKDKPSCFRLLLQYNVYIGVGAVILSPMEEQGQRKISLLAFISICKNSADLVKNIKESEMLQNAFDDVINWRPEYLSDMSHAHSEVKTDLYQAIIYEAHWAVKKLLAENLKNIQKTGKPFINFDQTIGDKKIAVIQLICLKWDFKYVLDYAAEVKASNHDLALSTISENKLATSAKSEWSGAPAEILLKRLTCRNSTSATESWSELLAYLGGTAEQRVKYFESSFVLPCSLQIICCQATEDDVENVKKLKHYLLMIIDQLDTQQQQQVIRLGYCNQDGGYAERNILEYDSPLKNYLLAQKNLPKNTIIEEAEIVKLVAQEVKNLNGVVRSKVWSPLSLACAVPNNVQMVEMLLQIIKDPNKKFPEVPLPSCIAAKRGDITLLKKLKKGKINFDLVDNLDGCNALHVAIMNQQEKTAYWLLHNSDNPLIETARGQTPLELCIIHKTRFIPEKLFEVDENCCVKPKHENSLKLAIECQNFTAVDVIAGQRYITLVGDDAIYYPMNGESIALCALTASIPRPIKAQLESILSKMPKMEETTISVRAFAALFPDEKILDLVVWYSHDLVTAADMQSIILYYCNYNEFILSEFKIIESSNIDAGKFILDYLQRYSGNLLRNIQSLWGKLTPQVKNDLREDQMFKHLIHENAENEILKLFSDSQLSSTANPHRDKPITFDNNKDSMTGRDYVVNVLGLNYNDLCNNNNNNNNNSVNRYSTFRVTEYFTWFDGAITSQQVILIDNALNQYLLLADMTLSGQGCNLDDFKKDRYKLNGENIKKLTGVFSNQTLKFNSTEVSAKPTHEIRNAHKDRILLFPVLCSKGEATLYLGAYYLPNGLHNNNDKDSYNSSTSMITLQFNEASLGFELKQ